MERPDGLRVHIGGWVLRFPGGRTIVVGGLSRSDDPDVERAIVESRRAMRVEPVSQRRAVIAWAERYAPRICNCRNGVLRPTGLLGWRCDLCFANVLFAVAP